MSYYGDLSVEEQGKVLSAMAGLKLNARNGVPITRAQINSAFMQALGKPLSMEYMRDPSVVQLLSLESHGKAEAAIKTQQANQFSSTDAHLAARGLPVPPASSTTVGSTRYSARVSTSSPASGRGRYGR
jgi:hypothetical protein